MSGKEKRCEGILGTMVLILNPGLIVAERPGPLENHQLALVQGPTAPPLVAHCLH